MALTTHPLRRHDSKPRPGPSARQRARPAELSERRVGLWRLSFRHTRALVCESRLRFFPLNTAPVVRRVVASAAAAQAARQGRAPTEDLGAPTRDAPGYVLAVTLRVRSSGRACVAMGPWSQVRIHRHSQAAEFGD